MTGHLPESSVEDYVNVILSKLGLSAERTSMPEGRCRPHVLESGNDRDLSSHDVVGARLNWLRQKPKVAAVCSRPA